MSDLIYENPTFGEMLDIALAAQEKLTPKTGANLVGVDKHEEPGNALYLIGHYDSEKEAKAAQAERKRAHPGEETHIYVA